MTLINIYSFSSVIIVLHFLPVICFHFSGHEKTFCVVCVATA